MSVTVNDFKMKTTDLWDGSVVARLTSLCGLGTEVFTISAGVMEIISTLDTVDGDQALVDFMEQHMESIRGHKVNIVEHIVNITEQP